MFGVFNMGTNYYWIKEDTTCPHCGRRDPDEERIHIGKSSGRQLEHRRYDERHRRQIQ